jgi:hypothetical protein
MSLETERAALEGRFKTAWDSTHPTMKVGYDGHTFEFVRNTTSIRLKIADGEAQQISFGDPGNNLVRNVGILLVQIATPGGAGTAGIRALEDEVMDLYRNQTFGGVRCRIPYPMGRDEEPPFLVSTICIPFERDEHNG